jgi:hypothetical protein
LRLAAAALLLLLAASTAGCNQGPPREATLVKDLSGIEWRAAEAAFNHRVQARFPVGTPESAVIKTLKHQGFGEPQAVSAGEPHAYPVPAGSAVRTARLDWSAFPCNVGAEVYWTTDGGGKVSASGGFYGERGCL